VAWAKEVALGLVSEQESNLGLLAGGFCGDEINTSPIEVLRANSSSVDSNCRRPIETRSTAIMD
jgi:hypothetical protein